MQTTIDGAGRVVIPKPLRDALGLTAGTTIDISRYGEGLALTPGGRTARLVERDGVLVATSETTVTNAEMFALIDASRR